MFEDEEREYLGRLPLQAFCPLDICVLVVDLELGRGRGISNLDKKARITRPAPLI